MKILITIFALIISTAAYGQTAKDYLQAGIDKHTKQDFQGAIAEYSKAIEADKENKEAYFNRGTCQLALKQDESALQDFSKTIELDPTFQKAYYSRATVYVRQKNYTDALPDLDKTIELNPLFPNALTLRGQVRAIVGNKKGACEDFMTAKSNGDKEASKYLIQFCGNEQGYGESLMLYWPESENWKIGDNQDNKDMQVLNLIHTNETLDNWTELASMTAARGITGVPVTVTMNIVFETSKKNSPESKLTFIEKDENAEFPWIIFTVESPNFKDDSKPESQLWYIVQGKQALYTNFRAIKQATIPADLKEKWTKFFKTGKIMYK